MTYYVAPSFLNKLAVHITKNYLDLPQVKVPLLLGIHGRKGEGKTFQCELVFKRMGVEVVYISGGELESPDAGDPARLIRLRYREAAELVRVRGCMAVLVINDLDAGAGRFDRMTQYTVNTQLVNNTLMNIADNPTNVQLPGSYDEKELPRIPIIATGNDFATLYAPLIRDGRMQKYYWEPSHEDRIGIVIGMFESDPLSKANIEKLVGYFDEQAIDFFAAIRSQIYDEQITQFIHSVGIENIAKNIVNSLKPPTFTRPDFQLEHLIEVGKTLVYEQNRVRTMGLVGEYNQAVTPADRSNQPHFRAPTTPAPDRNNHANNHADNQSNTHSQADDWKTNGFEPDRSSESSQQATRSPADSSSSAMSKLSAQTQQVLHTILAQGHRLGIEHVDKRRFQMNSWRSHITLKDNSEAAAADKLSDCLSQFPDHYVRLVSIDRQTKRRMNETIVQRPN
ncbi:MAG: ribulose 1,5-bisphosphate carboxylase [Phormidesmis priestleyi]|uniref:Ribulose 1,5-bisphosphate carboxylase n=1 Tax=Phormidesmis priestleyi TaxID=268141 RepID=A0A2W4XNL6_9CYAN|nr:MAG: ribulose 1,5-bisphosphate carboxylase [Phormidesmis priestleyi]